MKAVIRFQGKQFIVEPGQTIQVDKVDSKLTKQESFPLEVLTIIDDKSVVIGQPVVKDFEVKAKFVKDFKGKKIKVLRYKNKINYHVEKGHRSHYSQILIVEISKSKKVA